MTDQQAESVGVADGAAAVTEELDEGAIGAITDQIVACGAHNEALEIAREHVASGISALKVLEDTPAKEALICLAYHLVERVA